MAYTIDAAGKSLGRVATEAAHVLMGKHKPDFTKNKVTGEETKIVNVSKVRVSGTKAETKLYHRYSGYPGGLKTEVYKDIVVRRGYKEVMRQAVYGMIPGNKLRPQRMKLLTIEE